MTARGSTGRTAPEKSERAFRTISEVSADLGVPQHVLRFWETRFAQVRPIKRNGGRRLYRPDHVALLRGIRALLYDDALTIKGVQKMLREKGVKSVIARGAGDAGLGIEATPPGAASERLAAIRDRLAEHDPRAEPGAAQPEAAPAGTAGTAHADRTPPEPVAATSSRPAAFPRPRLDAENRARIEGSISRLEEILARLEA